MSNHSNVIQVDFSKTISTETLSAQPGRFVLRSRKASVLLEMPSALVVTTSGIKLFDTHAAYDAGIRASRRLREDLPE